MHYPKLQAILLVDDNPDDRLLAQRELNKTLSTLIIHEAIDQKEFGQMLATAEFDMVITDYQLGWSNGLKILRAVKAQRPQCPVIMFTNTGTQEIAVEAMKSGLSDYVVKSPQHFVRLGQAVKSVWRQFQTQLRAAQLEGQLQALLNQLEVGIFRGTPSGQLLDANGAVLSMLSVDSLAAAQSALQSQLALPASLALPTASNLPQQVASHSAEIELQRSEQPPLWLRVSATLSWINGEPIVDGLIEDITARKQAEKSLNQLNQTLEQQVQMRTQQLEGINRELETFAYSISHDLRSPIRQIDGFIALLKEHLNPTALDQKTQHYFDVLSGLVSQSGNMIDALLNFSRTGRVEMSPAQVDMSKIVRRIKAQINANHTADNIQWHIADLPAVKCDYTLMQTVWQNLIENAVKFTQDQASPEIWIGFDLHPTKTVFFVKDNGIGFEPKQRDKIFGMFQQAHSRKESNGLGIGLANVTRIISRHQGKVWAEGRVDEGATFYFSLPKEQVP
ncbi:MAG: ATP-binding protein [Phormidesmis sp.]